MNQQEIKELLTAHNQQIDIVFEAINTFKGFVWNTENIEKLCNDKKIININSPLEQSDIQLIAKRFQTYPYDEINTILSTRKAKIEKILKNFDKWDDYNQQYQTYIESQSNNFINQLSTLFKHGENTNLIQYLNSILAGFQIIKSNVNTNIDELFENFKYGNKNYVIFGKNGAGKTSLLNKIANDVINQNSFVIPANRSFKTNEDNNFYYKEQPLNQIFKNDLAILYLTCELKDKSFKEYEQGIIDNNIIVKFKNIFNSLGLERSIDINKFSIKLQAKDEEIYPLFKGSDGEKAVIFIIISILLLPQNAFIFIDEPELHLNGALMQKLFNLLEKERSDVKFIYVTHIINFVESRKNVELIYLEKINKHNCWKFKNIQNFEATDINMLLGIEGTQDDIIFCEGNDQASIDYKIFDSIFDDCLIKPVGSCELAINNTKLLHTTGKYSFLRRKAYAIIDNDFKNDEEIQQLSNTNIKVLEYNEMENLLLCEDIVTYINTKTLNHNISEIKTQIIQLISSRKIDTMTDFLNKKYKKIIDINKLSYTNLDKRLETMTQQNSLKLKQALDEYESKYNEFLINNDYENLIKIVPAKNIFKESAKILGFKDSNNYIDYIINAIKQDEYFKELLKNKINFQRN